MHDIQIIHLMEIVSAFKRFEVVLYNENGGLRKGSQQCWYFGILDLLLPLKLTTLNALWVVFC